LNFGYLNEGVVELGDDTGRAVLGKRSGDLRR
jgi:hypothetical protein